MTRNLTNRIVMIVIVLALALWVDLSDKITIINPFSDTSLFEHDVKPRLGLDLQGGMQVLLEADLPADTKIESESMNIARDIVHVGALFICLEFPSDKRRIAEDI